MAWNKVPDDVAGLRRRALFEVFTPAAPVARQDLFSGRADQLSALQETTMQKGQHAVIYGERGVGKTSLAKVARETADRDEMFTAHVTCDSADTFSSIWEKVLGEIRFVSSSEGVEIEGRASEYLTHTPASANDVRIVLSYLTQAAPAVVFIDEFDVIVDDGTRKAMAETLKILSDQAINATVVLVGVAESVTDLIHNHESTERNIVQVPMPRMSMDERLAIIESGMKVVEMRMDPDASQRIALLSQGLAQFVHLLAQRSSIIALNDRREEVTSSDVELSISIAIKDIHASVSSAYYEGTRSNQPTTLYPDLLLACALAETDERGFFTAKSLVDPLSKIAKRRIDIPAFGPHLDRLATDRGPVLQKVGEKRRFRYRFRNPLMQPYVLMKGVEDGRIDFDDLGRE